MVSWEGWAFGWQLLPILGPAPLEERPEEVSVWTGPASTVGSAPIILAEPFAHSPAAKAVWAAGWAEGASGVVVQLLQP